MNPEGKKISKRQAKKLHYSSPTAPWQSFVSLMIRVIKVNLIKMSGSLESYVGQPVIILSCDGRCFSATLKGKFVIFGRATCGNCFNIDFNIEYAEIKLNENVEVEGGRASYIF